MKISFTTLSCPQWSWEKILCEASRLGFDGIEIRGIEGEMYLPKAKPFLPENLDVTITELKCRNLKIICLGTSCKFHDPADFNAAIEEGKASIDLAEKLSVPYIRVFGDRIPNPDKKEEAFDAVARGMNELGNYSEGKGVTVLQETHGDFASIETVKPVFDKIQSTATGLLWDIEHTHKVYGKSFVEFYKVMGGVIKHIHIKDTKKVDGKFQLCLVGKGDVPIGSIIRVLRENNYTGWLSLEWEKKWHPELEEPEIAIVEYIDYIRKLL